MNAELQDRIRIADALAVLIPILHPGPFADLIVRAAEAKQLPRCETCQHYRPKGEGWDQYAIADRGAVGHCGLTKFDDNENVGPRGRYVNDPKILAIACDQECYNAVLGIKDPNRFFCSEWELKK